VPEVKAITTRYLIDVNCYLVKASAGYILIDTGFARRRSDLTKELEAAGCNPGDLKLIVITHGHLDHNGNTAYLRENYGAKIAMHSGDAGMAENGDMFWGLGGLTVFLARIMMYLLRVSRFDRFRPDIYLDDGQDLTEYGLDAKVIHIPGHSKGSIGLLTADGDLFCGDLFFNMGKLEKTSLIDDEAELNESIEKLKAHDIKTVYPGHGAPFRMERFYADN
jgi:hydroxyacylglutathione hydrolase